MNHGTKSETNQISVDDCHKLSRTEQVSKRSLGKFRSRSYPFVIKLKLKPLTKQSWCGKANHSKLFNLNHCSQHMKLETGSISNRISKTISQMENVTAVGRTPNEFLSSNMSARKSRWSLSYRKIPHSDSLLCFRKVSSFICFLMYIEG